MNAQIDISSIILKTDRLLLRSWRETDLQDFYNYASVDGVGQMAGWTPHKDLAESKHILSHFIEVNVNLLWNTREKPSVL